MKKLILLSLFLVLTAQTASARTVRRSAATSSAPSSAKTGATAAWKTANDYFVGKGVLPAVSGDPAVTRAELAEILVKLTGNVVDLQGYSDCAKDVRKESFAPALCFAAKQRWMDADKNGNLTPAASVTFGQALQAVVRSARLPATAGRGAWYVPFVNAAVKEGLIEKGDYANQIDAPLTRGRLAAMLYRLQLTLKMVSYPVGAACVPAAPLTATVKDGSIVVSDGKASCVIAADPLWKSDASRPLRQLVGLMPGLPSSNTAASVPMTEKRAYFLSVDGDQWLPFVWELDLKKGTLKQILNTDIPGAVRLSPKHTFLVYVGSNGVDLRAMNLLTGFSKSVRLLTTQVTFIKTLTMARAATVSDHILIDGDEALTFNVYDMNDGSLFQAKIRAQLDVLFNTRSSRSSK